MLSRSRRDSAAGQPVNGSPRADPQARRATCTGEKARRGGGSSGRTGAGGGARGATGSHCQAQEAAPGEDSHCLAGAARRRDLRLRRGGSGGRRVGLCGSRWRRRRQRLAPGRRGLSSRRAALRRRRAVGWRSSRNVALRPLLHRAAFLLRYRPSDRARACRSAWSGSGATQVLRLCCRKRFGSDSCLLPACTSGNSPRRAAST